MWNVRKAENGRKKNDSLCVGRVLREAEAGSGYTYKKHLEGEVGQRGGSRRIALEERGKRGRKSHPVCSAQKVPAKPSGSHSTCQSTWSSPAELGRSSAGTCGCRHRGPLHPGCTQGSVVSPEWPSNRGSFHMAPLLSGTPLRFILPSLTPCQKSQILCLLFGFFKCVFPPCPPSSAPGQTVRVTHAYLRMPSPFFACCGPYPCIHPLEAVL